MNSQTPAPTATVLHDSEIAVAANFLRLQSEGQIASQARSFEEDGEGEGGRKEPEMEEQLGTSEGELLEEAVKTGRTPQMYIQVLAERGDSDQYLIYNINIILKTLRLLI